MSLCCKHSSLIKHLKKTGFNIFIQTRWNQPRCGIDTNTGLIPDLGETTLQISPKVLITLRAIPN